jgi:TolA-binding protein
MEKKANSKLYMARKLEKSGKARLASKLYHEILEQYPHSEAARIAENHVGLIADTREDKALQQITRARELERLGSIAEARAEYEAVASKYPETEQGKTARERLADLSKKVPK